MGAVGGRPGARRPTSWSSSAVDGAAAAACRSTASSAPTWPAGRGDLDAPGWRKVVASVADLIGARRPRGRRPPAPRRPQALHLRAAVRQHERRPRAGVFQRRDQRGHHHRPLQGLGAVGGRPQHAPSPSRARPSTCAEVARELGVSHVLEGSVRKAGDRVRITAQLIDGASDSHVWAERYDRDLDRHLRPAGRDLRGHRRRR